MLVICLTCLIPRQAAGQEYPIQISIAVPPPYTPYVQAYISQPNKIMVTITNLSDSIQNIYLLGSISSEQINIYTDPDKPTPPPLTMQPYGSYFMNLDNIDDVFNLDQVVYEGITQEEILINQNLPEGDYTICLVAYDEETKEQLSADEPQGCSNTFTILTPGVPEILQPLCGNPVYPSMPQNINFSWTYAENAPPNTRYTLRIIEIQPGENINDAMTSGTHPVFFETTTTMPNYIYGPADPPLVAGKQYAFVVIASDPDGQIIFENNGWSEVCEFTYGTTIIYPPDTTGYGDIILYSPPNSDSVTGNPNFEWGINGEPPQNYTISLYYILPGQTHSEAVMNPPLMEETTTTTSMTFPYGEQNMEPCQYYCWTVSGNDSDGQTIAMSGIWTFVYTDPDSSCIDSCICSAAHQWFKGPPIMIERPLDYFPNKAIMEPREEIAFSILASDMDILAYKCSELGTDWEEFYEVPDYSVSYSWDLFCSDDHNVGLPKSTEVQNTFKFVLPKIRNGITKIYDLICNIASSNPYAIVGQHYEFINVKAQIILDGRADGCLDVLVRIYPFEDVPYEPLTSKEGKCQPGVIKHPGDSYKKGNLILPNELCIGKIYQLEIKDDEDLDKYTFTCMSKNGCKNPEPFELEFRDPLSYKWSDYSKTDINFPIGIKGPAVVYIPSEQVNINWIHCKGEDAAVIDGDVKARVYTESPDVCEINLTAEGLDDGCEQCPGLIIGVNDDDNKFDLVKITINNPHSRNVTLKDISKSKKVEFWSSDSRLHKINLPWKTSGVSDELWVEGIAPSEELRDVILWLEGPTCGDELDITVVEIDISTDLTRNIIINDDDEPFERSPGAYIIVNNDDDDRDCIVDINDGQVTRNPGVNGSQNENNLKKFTVSLNPEELPNYGRIELTRSDGRFRVYLDPKKGVEEIVGEVVANNKQLLWSQTLADYRAHEEGNGIKTWYLNNDDHREEFKKLATNGIWVEGLEPSEKEGDAKIAISYTYDFQVLDQDTITLTIISIENVNVDPSDEETYHEESNLRDRIPPADTLTLLHFVTAFKQNDVVLQTSIRPDIPKLYNKIRWRTTSPGITLKSPAVGTDCRTVSFSSNFDPGRKIPIDIVIDNLEWNNVVAWVVSATIVGNLTAPNIVSVFENHAGGRRRNGTFISPAFTSVATIRPDEIITDADHPALEGDTLFGPPGGRNARGQPLRGGANRRWDTSRRLSRTMNVYPGFVLRDLENNINFPRDPVVGNDDAGHSDEDNNPYNPSAAWIFPQPVPDNLNNPPTEINSINRNIPSKDVGQIISVDFPQRIRHRHGGNLDNTYHNATRFEEFARIQLGDLANGGWYVISDPCRWNVDWRFIKKSVGGIDIWIDNGSSANMP